MGIVEIFLIAVGLAMDAFAVSVSAGTSGYAGEPRAVFRLSFHFGLFQALMPLIGWSIGIQLSRWFSMIDHWIALALLAFVGLRMIRSGMEGGAAFGRDPSRGSFLILLALATSVDALAVGLSLGMLGVAVLYPCLVIGLVTATLSLVGIRLGSSLRASFGKRMEIVGGVVLILIGLHILLTHLFPHGPA